MAAPLATDARRSAWLALEELAAGGGLLRDLLPAHAACLSPADRALAAELAFGVARRRLTLDFLLGRLARRGRAPEGGLGQALRLGAYQLLFCGGIPARAAVHETVSLARQAAGEKGAALANALLRRLAGLAARGPAAGVPPERLLPLDKAGAADQGIVFSENLLPPEHPPARRLAVVHSHPEWLAARWLKRFGREQAEAVLALDNRPPPLTLRVNLLRTSRDEAAALLAAAGRPARPGTAAEALHLDAGGRVEDLPGFAEGLFAVQDEGALAASCALAPRPGERLWDACAAPGGKAGHLQELAGGQARLLLSDRRLDRLRLAAANARRLGHALAGLLVHDGALPALPEAPLFDGILLDAPCSNTGVLRRRVEARWRVTPEAIRRSGDLARVLLGECLKRLRPGGRLVYSTCSLEEEENEQVVQACLLLVPGLRLADQRLLFPAGDAAGGYFAVLNRD